MTTPAIQKNTIVERKQVRAEAMMAQGRPFEAFYWLRDHFGGINDRQNYPLRQTAATALRQAAARFAFGDRVSQRVRMELLIMAEKLFKIAEDHAELYRIRLAIVQAHLALGDVFPAAVAAHHALRLGLKIEALSSDELQKLARMMADVLEQTIAGIRRGDKAIWRQVKHDATAFDSGKLMIPKALAYRLTVDGMSAAMQQFKLDHPSYLEAAELYNRHGNTLAGMIALTQGTIFGVAMGLPWAMDAAADRLVLFAAKLEDKSAMAAMERAIELVEQNKPVEAHQVTLAAARTILNQFAVPLDIAIFMETAGELADYLWNNLEGKIRRSKDHPTSLATYVQQQMDLARQQFALWRQVVSGVMPLVGQNSRGQPLNELVGEGLRQLQNWADAYRSTVVLDRVRAIDSEDYLLESPSLSPALVRAIAATDWSRATEVNRLTLALAEVYGVKEREIEAAFMSGTVATPLTTRLRADLHPHTFGRASSAVMQLDYRERRDRWESRRR